MEIQSVTYFQQPISNLTLNNSKPNFLVSRKINVINLISSR